MSGLLLCSSKRGEEPYIIVKNEWEIWSLEELCYYLYQNAYEITEEFFSEELCAYLRNVLNVKELAEQLADMKQHNRNFAEMLMTVCEAANYYDREELLQLERRLADYAAMSKVERWKLTADSYMEKKRYVRALKYYEMILSCKNREHCEEHLLGRVYHNMGVAYGRMLMYHEAEEYLRESLGIFWKENKDSETARQIEKELLLLAYLAENSGQIAGMGLSEEERKTLTAEWETIRSSVKIEEGRNEAVIERWKQEYRTQMS